MGTPSDVDSSVRRAARPFGVARGAAHTIPQPPIAELVTVQTSPGCVSYRLLVRDAESLMAPRIVWSNRAFADIPESHAGGRGRAYAFALKEGYRIIDRTEVERRRRA